MSTCTACEIARDSKEGQWWNLSNYFGFTGFFCPDCHDKISHDGYDNPKNPKDYTFMLLKYGDLKYRQKENSNI